MVKHVFVVAGMHCKSCKILVNDALQDIGAKNITIVIGEKKQLGNVSFEHGDKEKAIKSIENEGYKVIEKKVI